MNSLTKQTEAINNRALRATTWDAIRYVDNRLTVHLTYMTTTNISRKNYDMMLIKPPNLESLGNPNFYGGAIMLEPEPGLDFLGLTLQATGLEVQGKYIVPGFDALKVRNAKLVFPQEYRWKYRSPASAGSKTMATASLMTRCHLAIRMSFPMHNIRQAVTRLIVANMALEMDLQAIKEALMKLKRRYKDVFRENFMKPLIEQIMNNDLKKLLAVAG